MIKFVAKLAQGSGNLYGFGLTEASLNRLQFNNEPVFFDFGYAGHPELFGLILYFDEIKEPSDLASSIDLLTERCTPFLDFSRGVTPDSLRVFAMARSVMEQFRATRFWGTWIDIEITNPGDKQLFFAGRDEREIEEYLQQNGLLTPETKRTYKGFGLPKTPPTRGWGF